MRRLFILLVFFYTQIIFGQSFFKEFYFDTGVTTKNFIDDNLKNGSGTYMQLQTVLDNNFRISISYEHVRAQIITDTRLDPISFNTLGIGSSLELAKNTNFFFGLNKSFIQFINQNSGKKNFSEEEVNFVSVGIRYHLNYDLLGFRFNCYLTTEQLSSPAPIINNEGKQVELEDLTAINFSAGLSYKI